MMPHRFVFCYFLNGKLSSTTGGVGTTPGYRGLGKTILQYNQDAETMGAQEDTRQAQERVRGALTHEYGPFAIVKNNSKIQPGC